MKRKIDAPTHVQLSPPQQKHELHLRRAVCCVDKLNDFLLLPVVINCYSMRLDDSSIKRCVNR